ncbi:MAG: hypothetical protein IIC85_15130 [Chloroflexi bacterium]|nr:hypothetical protein [Chloroflexota bacterium]
MIRRTLFIIDMAAVAFYLEGCASPSGHGSARTRSSAEKSHAFLSSPGQRGEGDNTDADPQLDFDINATDFPDPASQLLA